MCIYECFNALSVSFDICGIDIKRGGEGSRPFPRMSFAKSFVIIVSFFHSLFTAKYFGVVNISM